jgi:hypothetical protein
MAMTARQAPYQPIRRRALVKRRVVASAPRTPGAPNQPGLA